MFKKIFSGLLTAVLILFVSAPALAAPTFFANDDDENIIITTPIGDDTYIAGGDVTVDGDIAGDLFVAGGMEQL